MGASAAFRNQLRQRRVLLQPSASSAHRSALSSFAPSPSVGDCCAPPPPSSSSASLPRRDASPPPKTPCPSSRRRETFRSSFRSVSSRAVGATVGTSGLNEADAEDGRLRVAVVGGGAAGMAAALHLSPLVAAGLVSRPVDVYESTVVKKSKGGACRGGGGGRQRYPGSGALGREIGVGIWSTAWWPFLRSLEEGMRAGEGDPEDSPPTAIGRQKDRQSYRTLLQDLEACGSYVADVGYRTPDGGWLVKSELNASPYGITDLLGGREDDDGENDAGRPSGGIDNEDPALLFVRERDLLSCLRNAVKMEQRLGTLKYRSGVRVEGIDDVRGDLGSLVLRSTSGEDEDGPYLSPRYHLVVAADGIYSLLRSRFAGHRSVHASGTGMESSSARAPSPGSTLEYQWEHGEGQREATQVEDRQYVVFRGNAPKLEGTEEDGSGSFQTWGQERSMRFAAVPFYHETEDLEDEENDSSNSSGHYSRSRSFTSKKKDEEVWFATISDPSLVEDFVAAADPNDPIERKQQLMRAFGSWHKPVQRLIETTPAEDIIYERAIAHRHMSVPVFDVGRIMEFEKWRERTRNRKDGNGAVGAERNDKIDGRGPMLCFIGDSYMTVDPVLAQGFTVAMEAGASLARSLERTMFSPGSSSPVFRPDLLRDELQNRDYCRERRLLQMLRSTELVQRLAQPHGIGSVIATWIVRPMMKICPKGLKKRIFDYMIRYSLGLSGEDENGRGKQ